MGKSILVARIEGDTEDVNTVVRMFAYFKEIIRRGAGRTIKIHIDGDGSADCKCFLATNREEINMILENTQWEEVHFIKEEDLKEVRKKIDSNKDFDLYIGE